MKLTSQNLIAPLFAISVVATLIGCAQTGSDKLNTGAAANGVNSSVSLYVASGACYGGGVATAAGSGTIVNFDPSTGNVRRVVIDYSLYSPGDLPVAISNYDSTRLLVTVENASGRHVDLVNKDGSGAMTYLTNSTALNGVLRSAKLLNDGSLLVSKSSAVEKFAPSKARVLQGANPFINAPASTCATATTLISAVETSPSGKVIFAHAAATPNNKVDVISATGYNLTTDCLGGVAVANTLALPSALLLHSSGRLLVATGSTTAASNIIYSYPYNDTTSALGTAVSAYADSGVLINGPSALTEDPVNADVYVANALSTMNTIERFSYDPTAQTLTSRGQRLGPSVYTRCVSAMKAVRE